MTCNWLEVSLDKESSTILEERTNGIKLYTNTHLQNGIYTFNSGWLTLRSNTDNNTHATIMTSSTYDIDYLRRAYKKENLPEIILGKTPNDPQVIIAKSCFPKDFLLNSGIGAREEFNFLGIVGNELKFMPYKGYNPYPKQLIPGEKYPITSLAGYLQGQQVLLVKVGDEQLKLGEVFFQIPGEKLKRTSEITELADLNTVLSHLYN
jgi:hypothetical protein